MSEWTLSSLHRKAYGTWAGNRNGNPPDPTRCAAEVTTTGGFISHQCSRPRGHGPEQAYCKQHDPAVVKARRDAEEAKYNRHLAARQLEWAGPRFFKALCKIADGDNDPRQTAIDAVKDYR